MFGFGFESHLEVGDVRDRDARLQRTLQHLRERRAQLDQQAKEEQHRRRAEDRVREELRDSRAKTVKASD